MDLSSKNVQIQHLEIASHCCNISLDYHFDYPETFCLP